MASARLARWLTPLRHPNNRRGRTAMDKYAGVPFSPFTVPKGASFKDMVALKGKPAIGDDISILRKVSHLGDSDESM